MSDVPGRRLIYPARPLALCVGGNAEYSSHRRSSGYKLYRLHVLDNQSVDAKRRETTDPNSSKWEVFIHGGRTPTGIDAVSWAKKMESLGAGEILLTSMDRDGTRDGYNIELTRAISRAVNIPVIASGGVGTIEHIYEGLVSGEADAALAASIFHYREKSIREVKEYLHNRQIPVRL